MPLYDYRAVTRSGEAKTGQMNAASDGDVITRLQSMGLIPISADLHQGDSGSNTSRSFFSRFRKSSLGTKDIGDFTRQLSTLVGAGLPLDRSLEIIGRVSTKPLMVELITAIQSAVRSGLSLSVALQEHEELFPSFYINFVRAAELSGDLAKSLDDLSIYMDKSHALREQLKSALMYPMILVGVTILSLGIIVIFVLPEFAALFEDMDAALPSSTAFVLGVSGFLRHYALLIVVALLALVVYFRKKSQDPAWRYWRDEWLLQVALLSDLIKKVNMARFSRSLGTLLTGGVALLPAMAVAKEGLQNAVLQEKLEGVIGSLEDGGGLAEPLLESGVFPEFALQMIQVGEETGQLDRMLVRVADIYDDEVASASQRLLSVLEPLMIIGLGLVIGGIIMSILVAILGINDLPM